MQMTSLMERLALDPVLMAVEPEARNVVLPDEGPMDHWEATDDPSDGFFWTERLARDPYEHAPLIVMTCRNVKPGLWKKIAKRPRILTRSQTRPRIRFLTNHLRF